MVAQGDAGFIIFSREGSAIINLLVKCSRSFRTIGVDCQVKLLLPKFHRADSALQSQAAGGVGVCASVAPPDFGCWLGSTEN